MPAKKFERRKQPTIFGRIAEKNVTFLVDTSGSMYKSLDDVKDNLIRALTEKSVNEYDGMFNIIAFSDDVCAWASSLMPCTERTVSIATDWIRQLESKASTNTQDALLLALQDPGADAIYLVTDGHPNDQPAVILHNIKKFLKGRPIHCFYISGSQNDNQALGFLKRLAYNTDGSVHLISVDGNGNIRDVDDMSVDETDVPSLSSSDSRKVWFEEGYRTHHPNGLDHDTRAKGYAWESRTRSPTIREEYTSSLAASLMTGRKVLARRDKDGYYYIGTVIHASSSNTFRVKFGKCFALRSCLLEQETLLENMISYEDGLRNDIKVGEKVLAPLGDDGRYGPGTVVEGVDSRKRQPDGYICETLIVSMFDGQTQEVPCGISVKISEELNARIRSEIFLPESLRNCSGNGFNASSLKEDMWDTSVRHNDRDKKLRWSTETLEKKPELRDRDGKPLDRLQSKIERQIEEGELLLQKLYLEDREYARDLGYGDSEDSELTYKAYEKMQNERPNIDKESFRTWRDRVLVNTFRSTPKPTKDAWIHTEEAEQKAPTEQEKAKSKAKKVVKEEGYFKHRLELLNHWEKHKHAPKYSPHIMYETPSPPSKPKNFERSKLSTEAGRKQKKIKYRATTLKSYTEPKVRRKQFVEPRPVSKEYHAFDGVPFPPSTDRKFKQPHSYKESWTVDAAAKISSQPINIITNKPIEYFRNGHGGANGQRDLSGTRNVAHENREGDRAKDRARKERIVKDREEFHRISKEQRENERQEKTRKYKEGEELNRQQRRAVREKFIRYQKDKEEKAQRYKQERLDAMREKRINKDIQDTNRERNAFEGKEKLLNGQAGREQERRTTFEAALDSEIKMQEKQLARLRKIHSSRLNKEDTRTNRAFQARDLRDHVQDQSRQIYRASILP